MLLDDCKVIPNRCHMATQVYLSVAETDCERIKDLNDILNDDTNSSGLAAQLKEIQCLIAGAVKVRVRLMSAACSPSPLIACLVCMKIIRVFVHAAFSNCLCVNVCGARMLSLLNERLL